MGGSMSVITAPSEGGCQRGKRTQDACLKAGRYGWGNPANVPFELGSAIVLQGATMTLSEQIQKDIVAAMKAKEEMRLSVLRMIKSALQLKEVEKMRPLDGTESIQLLQTLAKQRKESIEQFAKGGRQDLVERENSELKILESYLPAGASEAEMDAAIQKAINDVSATSIKQMGAVVKAAKEALTGKAVDGKALSDRVRERLSKAG
jgi:uncharacterized protein YqeY